MSEIANNFDIFECGYNVADETLNFGTRNLADGDNLYQSATLAVFKCHESEKGVLCPHINTVCKNGDIYFTVNNSMRIFKNRELNDVAFHANFDSFVDVISVGEDFVIICFRNGTVSLLDCKTGFEVTQSVVLVEDCEEGDVSQKFFVGSFTEDNCSVLILTRKGQLIRILCDNLLMKMETVCEFGFTSFVASFSHPSLLVIGDKLAICNVTNKLIVSDPHFKRKFKTVHPLDHMFFLALDFEGNLFRICAMNLIVFPVKNTTFYKDFQLVSDLKCNQYIILVSENEQSCLQLMSYPDMSISYSLKISGDIHIIAPESINDELIFISKNFVEDNVVNELRFHILYETEPELRLERLLRKRRYKEAEKFATLFHLDLTLINKAKVQEIIDKPKCSSKDIENAIQLLNMIENDDEFKLKSCLRLESSCSRLEDVERILKYGCDLQLKKRHEGAEDLQEFLMNLKFKFETCKIIYRKGELQSWLQFEECNLMDELKFFLGNCKIDEAKILYNRLDKLTVKTVTVDQIADILDILNNMPMSVCQPFLPTFIPITLSMLPSSLPLFVKWTYRKVFYLEKRKKTDFPNNAITFIENVVGLMKIDDPTDFSFHKECSLNGHGFAKLSALLSALKNIKILKNNHGITISVDEYLSGPQNVVRNLLNVKMCFNDFDELLNKFLFKFMLENDLEPDKIFYSEIQDLMRYTEDYWVNLVTPIINCISSISVKLDCVRIILDSASVPWCETVRKIAKNSLKYSHPQVEQVKEFIEGEPIQIILRKPKYGIQEKRIKDISTLQFVVNRIIYCNEETMIDDVYQLCKTRKERQVASVLLITNLIKRRCLEKAVELLDDMPPEERFDVAHQLQFHVYCALNREGRMSDDVRHNYYCIAGAVFKRLIDCSRGEFQKRCYQDDLNVIKSVHNLRKKFQIETTTHKFKKPSTRKTIIEEILEENRTLFESGKRSAEDVISTCRKLSASLSLAEDELMVKFCHRSGDYNFLLKAAKQVYEKESSAKSLCLMAVLLMKFLGNYTEPIHNDSYDSDTSISRDGVDCNAVFFDGLQMAHKLVEKAIFRAPSEDLSKCLEVARWVNSSFYSSNCDNKELRRKLFGDLYDSGHVIPSVLTFISINNTFNGYCRFIKLFNNPNDDYLTYFELDKITDEELFNMIRKLPILVENLCKEGQQFTSYRIVSTLRNSLIQYPNIDENIKLYLSNFLQNKCIPMLMYSILSCTTINTSLFYNLLLTCKVDFSVDFILNSLRLFKRHPRKFASLIQVAIKFFDYHNISQANDAMSVNLMTLKWWKRFDKISEYDVFFKAKAEERFKLLVAADCLDSKLVEEYARDYGLNVKMLYGLFLKKLLMTWKPEYVIETDIWNKKRLVMKNDENQLLKKCHEIIGVMEEEQIQQIINTLWGTVNKYYYEVLITMLKIGLEMNSKQDKSKELKMLMFLKNYQRVSSPSEREKEMWYTSFPDVDVLDPISEFRIPFSGLLFNGQIWSIIRPEINLTTYKLWFKAIDIMAPLLNINDLCSYVVKDVVSSGILTQNTSEEWVLYPKHNNLFTEIEECVSHITDPERTTSVLYHLLAHTPNGADKVTIANLCYKYAVEYKNSTVNSEVQNAYVKVEKKYFTSAATHILYTYQLAETKYMNLVAHPKELISKLYLDERILKRSESVQLDCPDINKATEALATLFNLDIFKIRSALVENWLSDSALAFDFDSSMVYSDITTSKTDNLKRAAYVCADQLSFWQRYLFQVGSADKTSERRDIDFRTRALKVFAMISDAETIRIYTELNYDEFMYFIDKLALVGSLQHLGIRLDVDALNGYDKKELLNRLRHNSGNHLSIKTMADICMTYKIYDSKYWEFILNTSSKFSMFLELKNYVAFLKDEKFYNKRFYIQAWQKLIENDFVSLSSFKSDKLTEVLVKKFLMIQSCPVLCCLNFENVFRRCMDVNKPEFAAVLLQYISSEQRVVLAKEIVGSKTDLNASLQDLAEKGLCGIQYIEKILSESH